MPLRPGLTPEECADAHCDKAEDADGEEGEVADKRDVSDGTDGQTEFFDEVGNGEFEGGVKEDEAADQGDCEADDEDEPESASTLRAALVGRGHGCEATSSRLRTVRGFV